MYENWKVTLHQLLPKDMSSSSSRLMPSSCDGVGCEGNSGKVGAEGEVSSPVRSNRAVLFPDNENIMAVKRMLKQITASVDFITFLM